MGCTLSRRRAKAGRLAVARTFESYLRWIARLYHVLYAAGCTRADVCVLAVQHPRKHMQLSTDILALALSLHVHLPLASTRVQTPECKSAERFNDSPSLRLKARFVKEGELASLDKGSRHSGR